MFLYIIVSLIIVMSRPTPQTSVGRLVGLTVDNPMYYTSSAKALSSSPPPPLIPIAAAHTPAPAHAAVDSKPDGEELTMLWRNIANLFAKYDNIESNIEKQEDITRRCTDEVYQELQEVRNDVGQLQNREDTSAKLVRKIRKYVNKKCESVRETVSYGSYNADNEIFDYVNKTRSDLELKNKKLEDEIVNLRTEMKELNGVYDNDYEMFVKRENELMAKLETAVKMNEDTNNRMKNMEDVFMKEIQQVRNYANTHVAGDLREEFSEAICRELAFESKVSAQLVQSVNDDLTELITRSNEYHSARYFGSVEDVKQLRETCQSLKQSIGMVDAELSDTKDTVEYLKDEVGHTTTDVSNLEAHLKELNDDVYRELDRDYFDLKDYVKRSITRHKHHEHKEPTEITVAVPEQDDTGALQLIVDEYSNEPIVPVQQDQANDEHVIIIDENMVISDDEDDFKHT